MSFGEVREGLSAISLMVAALIVSLPGPALADCRADLLATNQTLQTTRAGLDQADAGAKSLRCAAYRRHFAAMKGLREVFARCDHGQQRVEHVEQLNSSIADFSKIVQNNCKP